MELNTNINDEQVVHTEIITESTVDELKARIIELENALKEEQLRGLANDQNLRRRHQEELQNTNKFAAQKFASQMLTIKDYLEMALLDQSGNFDALKMGVSMTLTELEKAFEAVQIQTIQSNQGDKLDPHLHQAMGTIETNEVEQGTICTTLKKGYTMHERVLRPAMVNVAVATGATQQAE